VSKEELNKNIALLKSEYPLTRYWAALYLEEVADKDAVPALIEVFGRDDPDMKVAAAKALAKIGPDAEAAIPALTELLKDEERWVSAAAEYAMEKIKG
jgi:HEAT repeat protein